MAAESDNIERNIKSLLAVIHDSGEETMQDDGVAVVKDAAPAIEASAVLASSPARRSPSPDDSLPVHSTPNDTWKQTERARVKGRYRRRTRSTSTSDLCIVEDSPPDNAGPVPTEKTPLLGRASVDSDLGAENTKTNCCAAQLGLIYALIAALSSSIVNALVKGLTNTDPAALAMFRFAFIFLPSGIVAFRRRSIFPRGYRFTLILRALTGTLGLIAKFYALRLMPLADASVIILSVPVFVAVFARIFLKEPFTWINAVTIVSTITGIILIIQPPFLFGGSTSQYHVLGPILAIASNLLASNSYVQLRQLRDVHHSVTISVFCLVAVPLSCICWMAVSDLAPTLPTDAVSWGLILGVCLLSYSVQLFFTKACQIEDAGPVSVVRTTDIIFAVVWQIVFFHQIPGLFSWIGMAMIISAVLMLGIYKWYETHKKRAAARQSPT